MSDTLVKKECSWCGGTGYQKATEPSEHSMAKLIQLALVARKLQNMSDKEIADLLVDHVYAKANFLDNETDLISSAIDRLKRSNGGALPDVALSIPK